MEHFGLTSAEAEDYFEDNTWWSILEHADKNQIIYQQVFGIYPDDSIKTFKDIEKVKKNAQLTKYEDYKALIKGNAVKFQKHFLSG